MEAIRRLAALESVREVVRMLAQGPDSAGCETYAVGLAAVAMAMEYPHSLGREGMTADPTNARSRPRPPPLATNK